MNVRLDQIRFPEKVKSGYGTAEKCSLGHSGSTGYHGFHTVWSKSIIRRIGRHLDGNGLFCKLHTGCGSPTQRQKRPNIHTL